MVVDMRIQLSDRASGGSARDQVYAALREAIVCAELEPGRRLSENELADALGVSRTPVREALVRLRDERLVAIVPQLGTFVTLISTDAVADAAFVREALECSAIRLATEQAAERDLEELQANLAAQERAEESGDTEAFDRLDDALHRTSASSAAARSPGRSAGAPTATSTASAASACRSPATSARWSPSTARSSPPSPTTTPTRAEAALRHHLRMVLSSLPRIRAAHPDYFEEA